MNAKQPPKRLPRYLVGEDGEPVLLGYTELSAAASVEFAEACGLSSGDRAEEVLDQLVALHPFTALRKRRPEPSRQAVSLPSSVPPSVKPPVEEPHALLASAHCRAMLAAMTKAYEPKLGLDMPFGEALERFIGVKPSELEANVAKAKKKRPSVGRKRKPTDGQVQAENVVGLRSVRMKKHNGR